MKVIFKSLFILETFGNIETQKCENCHSSCLFCDGPTLNDCLELKISLYV